MINSAGSESGLSSPSDTRILLGVKWSLMSRTVLLISSAALLLALGSPAAFAASDCTSLMNMAFPDVTVTAGDCRIRWS
jgi:hypothetical protein